MDVGPYKNGKSVKQIKSVEEKKERNIVLILESQRSLPYGDTMLSE